MDWRYSSSKDGGNQAAPRPSRARAALWGLLAAALALAAAGCGRHAVRASEKEFLADRVMIFDSDSQETAADEHILSNREGSTGGRGTGGGGCGCN